MVNLAHLCEMEIENITNFVTEQSNNYNVYVIFNDKTLDIKVNRTNEFSYPTLKDDEQIIYSIELSNTDDVEFKKSFKDKDYFYMEVYQTIKNMLMEMISTLKLNSY